MLLVWHDKLVFINIIWYNCDQFLSYKFDLLQVNIFLIFIIIV